MTLRVALIGGPMYDAIDEVLADHDVEVVVRADHPTLNREVATRLAAGERIDVMSTHGKYTPSQAAWLRPLDGLLADEAIAGLSEGAVDLCRFDGRVYSVPRVVDVRILWADETRFPLAVPDTWDDVVDAAEGGAPFGMPGRESGLFGTFFELVVGAGGRLLSEGVALDRAPAEAAVVMLQRLAAAGPDRLTDWHYDGVDDALVGGVVAAAAAWPGATTRIRAEASGLRPHPYPSGSTRRVTYSGCHSWAIPETCGDVAGAVALVETLCGVEAQSVDARSGSICANVEAFAAVTPVDEVDERRLELTRSAMSEQMITYPPLAGFPVIEDRGWSALRSAMLGTASIDETVDTIEAAITEVGRQEGLL